MAKVKAEENKKEGLDLFLAEMNKTYGKEIFVKDLKNITVTKIKTGSLALDIALDGGIPKGKMAEIFGINQSGKSSLCYETAANFQKQFPGEEILMIDLEDTFTDEYVKSLGIDTTKNFRVMKPKTGEHTYEILISFAKNIKGGLIILDSFALLLPTKEDEGDVGAAQMGSAARLNSQGLRKLFPHSAENGTTILFINQVRSTFDMYAPVATSGGKSLPFYARTRLHLSKVKGEEGVSNGCNIKLEKATYGKEGTKVNTFRLKKGKFDIIAEVMTLAEEVGIVERSGSYYSYEGTALGQGKGQLKQLLEDNPELLLDIENRIRKHYGII